MSNCTDSDSLKRIFANDVNALISRHSAQDLIKIALPKLSYRFLGAIKFTVNLNKTYYSNIRNTNKKVPTFLFYITIDDIILR